MNDALRLTEAAVEFLWWWVGWWWGLQSHIHVCVEVVLRCVLVGVVTIDYNFNLFDFFIK